MNSVVLVGRLARDPELRFIPSSGMAVARFTKNYLEKRNNKLLVKVNLQRIL